MLLWVCSIIDGRKRQIMARTSATHSAAPHVQLFCPYHVFTLSVIYYRTDAWQHGIDLFNTAFLNFSVLQNTLRFVIPYLVKKASPSSSAILRHIAKELKMNRREMLLENFKFIFSFLVRTCSASELEKALGYVQVSQCSIHLGTYNWVQVNKFFDKAWNKMTNQ